MDSKPNIIKLNQEAEENIMEILFGIIIYAIGCLLEDIGKGKRK